jgi:hypothetical protein
MNICLSAVNYSKEVLADPVYFDRIRPKANKIPQDLKNCSKSPCFK